MFPAYGPVPTGLVAANCPRYTIDLDLPAIDRWRELVGVYRDIIRSADTILDTQLRDALPRLGPILRGVAETAASAAAKLNRVMFKDDLTAFAELCDIPLGRVIALQLIYEASALCTSVVSQLGTDVTTPVHIRTMDWEMPFLRPLTVELLFVRGGQPLFICTTWAGYVGVLTGMRCDPTDASKNFSISINFRSPGDGTFWTNVGRAMDGAWPIGFLVRESLQEATGFKQAASWLRASELIAPCYVTITGPTSGELITRNRTFVPPSTDEPNPDNHLALDSAPGGAIVQTNADHWIDPTVDRSADIMESAERRKLTHRGLTARNCCAADPMWAESLWNVMSQYPVCNEITIYGTLMVPALAIYETRIPAMQPAGGRRVRLGLRATPPSTRPRVTADDYPTCKNCGQRFDPTVNAKGQCAHTKPWHAAYADCQKLKCGWGLGPSNIGKQHWGCCFSTDRDLEVRCSESGPHEA